ncbi:hypothetical protein [Vitreimonas flagellata]|uniref:hypothetical protein n=1 Tax=Vitreimonas flagellata TaxID=2560861 RepID=UPI001074C1A8|nr:hypothetical protein [Vitreimonas flagellata]
MTAARPRRAKVQATKPAFAAWMRDNMGGDHEPELVEHAQSAEEAARWHIESLFRSGATGADHLPFDVLTRHPHTGMLQRFRCEQPPAFVMGELRTCHQCGCTDDDACDPPCSWVSRDLCSACKKPARRPAT